jgi:hypothetical protein
VLNFSPIVRIENGENVYDMPAEMVQVDSKIIEKIDFDGIEYKIKLKE